MDFPDGSLPTDVEKASGQRDPHTVFRSLARHTGRRVDELARAAAEGRLAALIAGGARALNRRRRSTLEQRRYPNP